MKRSLESTAGTGHFYTTTKNKKTMPEKMEIGSTIPRPASTSPGRRKELASGLSLEKPARVPAPRVFVVPHERDVRSNQPVRVGGNGAVFACPAHAPACPVETDIARSPSAGARPVACTMVFVRNKTESCLR